MLQVLILPKIIDWGRLKNNKINITFFRQQIMLMSVYMKNSNLKLARNRNIFLKYAE